MMNSTPSGAPRAGASDLRPATRGGRRIDAARGLLLAALLAGTAVVTQAQPFGGGRHPGREGAPPPMFGGPPERVGAMADRMLDGLNVTDAQRTRIRQIFVAAAGDPKAERDASRDLRERGMRLLTAPTVDAAAVETLRQQWLAGQDRSSRRMFQAMVDAANVLTPEQRATFAQRLAQREAILRDRAARMPPPPPALSGSAPPAGR